MSVIGGGDIQLAKLNKVYTENPILESEVGYRSASRPGSIGPRCGDGCTSRAGAYRPTHHLASAYAHYSLYTSFSAKSDILANLSIVVVI